MSRNDFTYKLNFEFQFMCIIVIKNKIELLLGDFLIKIKLDFEFLLKIFVEI